MADTDMESDVPFADIDWARQEEEDQAVLSKFINQGQQDGDAPDLESIQFEGSRAADAEDYEDISDDDLPDEEPAGTGSGHRSGDDDELGDIFGDVGPEPDADTDVPGLTDDHGTSNELDELFEGSDDDDLFGEKGDANEEAKATTPEAEVEPEKESLESLMAINFPGYRSNQDPNIPAPLEIENNDALVKAFWPDFEQDTILQYDRILGPSKTYFVPKAPLKTPKPLAPTKVSLDVAPDQEKLFRASGPARSSKRKRAEEAEAKGWVAIYEESSDEQSDVDDFDYTIPRPDSVIGRGLSWAKLEALCEEDFKTWGAEESEVEQEEEVDEPMDEWERSMGYTPKSRKATQPEPDYFDIRRYVAPSFDNFQEDTARLAKRIILDESDPYLLLEIEDPVPELEQMETKRQRIDNRGGFAKRGSGLNAALKARFNYSNDEAYDALKENHSHKVRATLSQESLEHGMPALRLQWPYYRTRLSSKQARSLHRPTAEFGHCINHVITFAKPGMRKRKTTVAIPAKTLFDTCKDLTLADHYSTAALFEYCEQHPMILSNFGMGNRVINYYRRGDDEDRKGEPKGDMPGDKVGDQHILLPEDKSPFTKFGMVDPGKYVRAISNEMFRAPIFDHPTKETDFLITRSTTNAGGSTFHLRKIDNIFAVGQQLPVMEIPGPSSRKHTNVAKHRMRMLVNRLMKHNQTRTVKTSQLTLHIAGSSDIQNRQKLKDFVEYDKTEKNWRLKANQEIPDEATIRGWIHPEDVCGVDAMQVGCQRLRDLDIAIPGLEGDDTEKLDKVKYEDKGLEEKLAPWVASKAFIDASENRAMLQLHGEGDPTGCGLGLSFVRISMKGGYQGGPNSTSNTAMTALDKKANGGHSYNVKKQEALYEADIRDKWLKQQSDLSNKLAPVMDDAEFLHDDDADDDVGPNGSDDDDDDVGDGAEYMTITRTTTNEWGQRIEDIQHISDKRVYEAYIKRVHLRDNKATE